MGFRFKIFLSTLLISALGSYLTYIFDFKDFSFWGVIIVMFFLFYFVSYWVFDFNIAAKGFITVLILPSFFLISFLMIWGTFIKQTSWWLLMFFSFWAFVLLEYYLMLNQNILNLGLHQPVGLYKAALNINVFYGVLVFFIFSIAVFLTNWWIGFKLVLCLFIFIFLFIIHSFLYEINNVIRFLIVIFSVFVFLIFMILFNLGFVKDRNIILVPMSLSIIFKNVNFMSLYHARVQTKLEDYVMVFVESLIVLFLMYLSSL